MILTNHKTKFVQCHYIESKYCNILYVFYAITEVKDPLCFNHTEEFKLGWKDKATLPRAVQSMLTN